MQTAPDTRDGRAGLGHVDAGTPPPRETAMMTIGIVIRRVMTTIQIHTIGIPATRHIPAAAESSTMDRELEAKQLSALTASVFPPVKWVS